MATTSRWTKWVTEGFYGDAKERQITCDRCDGRGETYQLRPAPGPNGWGRCVVCKGTGTRTEWYWD